jgi:DNA-binding SARP family transcriptional activator
MTAAGAIRYGILGPVEPAGDRAPVALGGSRMVALLAYLLVNANRAVAADQIVDALWAVGPAPRPLKRLQVGVARLRRALEGAGAAAALRTVAGGYVLEVAPGELDADRFRDGLRAGQDALGRR